MEAAEQNHGRMAQQQQQVMETRSLPQLQRYRQPAGDRPTAQAESMRVSPRDYVKAQYWIALHADAQLSATIAEYAQPGRTRWTLTAQDLQHAKIRAALTMKLDEDAKLRSMFAEVR